MRKILGLLLVLVVGSSMALGGPGSSDPKNLRQTTLAEFGFEEISNNKTPQSTESISPNTQQKKSGTEDMFRFSIAQKSFPYTSILTGVVAKIEISNLKDTPEELIKLAEELKTLCDDLKKEAESVVTYVKEGPDFKFCCGYVALYLNKMEIRPDLALALFRECSQEEMTSENIFSVIKSDPGQASGCFEEYVANCGGIKNV